MAFTERSIQGIITGTSTIPSILLTGTINRIIVKSFYIHHSDISGAFIDLSKYVGTGTKYRILNISVNQDDTIHSEDGDIIILDSQNYSLRSYITSGSFISYPNFDINYAEVS